MSKIMVNDNVSDFSRTFRLDNKNKNFHAISTLTTVT